MIDGFRRRVATTRWSDAQSGGHDVGTTSVSTSLPPAEVMSVLTDFGPERVDRWASIDAEHFEVHGSGPGWADVNRGDKLGWERTRYTWDADAGTVGVETLESNLWGPGSRGTTGSDRPATAVRQHARRHADAARQVSRQGDRAPVAGLGARMIKGNRPVFEKVSGNRHTPNCPCRTSHASSEGVRRLALGAQATACRSAR